MLLSCCIAGDNTKKSMKRRGVTQDGGKLRRPVKKQKFAENLYGFGSGQFFYGKLLCMWFLVLLADYCLEFRFEYLWPFWLFCRSVYDSLRYQGLAFSVFFICIAITSDMICYLFIPVTWLFFAASAYVWVQYVWHTEKGVCLPTVLLWAFVLWFEAVWRFKDFKWQHDAKSLPFHMDLCRPFAAHCIGYPVVTLSFGFKSYIGYRWRQKKQKEVERENDHYYEFLREALPVGPVREDAFNPHPSPKPCHEDRISSESGQSVICSSPVSSSLLASAGSPTPAQALSSAAASSPASLLWNGHSGGGGAAGLAGGTTGSSCHAGVAAAVANSVIEQAGKRSPEISKLGGGGGGVLFNGTGGAGISELIDLATSNHNLKMSSVSATGKGSGSSSSCSKLNGSLSNGDLDYMDKLRDEAACGGGGGGDSDAAGARQQQLQARSNSNKFSTSSGGGGGGGGSGHVRDTSRKGRSKDDAAKQLSREEQTAKFEADLKRLKVDLQISRNKENELRDQIVGFMSGERFLKSEISNLQVEKNVLESRIAALLTSRSTEKANLSAMEKKLADERKQKAEFQIKLETERKTKKEAANAERTAVQNQTRSEVAKLEAEMKTLRCELSASRERCQAAEQELYILRKFRETHGDPDLLVQALNALRDKNVHLEKSLSSETKIKMDLFSALGEAKRELGIRQSIIHGKDMQICELKTKIAEVLAVMPSTSSSGGSGNGLVGAASLNTSNSLSSMAVAGTGLSTFSQALSLDLPPPSTDLTFTHKLSAALGLADVEDRLGGAVGSGSAGGVCISEALGGLGDFSSGGVGLSSVVGGGVGAGLYTPASLAGSTPFTPKTNGSASDM